RGARPKSQPPGPQNNAWLALGGLPKLLMDLETSFRFGPVAESRLDGLRVWTVEGQWKPAKLAELLPDQKATIEAGGAADTRHLSPNLPDSVVLHMGCDDLFPYRFEYWRCERPDKKAQTDGRGKLLAVLEMFEVQLGAPIDPGRFAYQPGALQSIDRTQEYLDKLGLQEVAPAGANRNLPRRR
ncbi:MAG: hypothetical protein HY288_20120, partial [Planctomycetia bacterium]|nr:hypothetical protein [Planctomycetia bacterium]